MKVVMGIVIALSACGMPQEDYSSAVGEVAWSAVDDPNTFDTALEYEYDLLPKSGASTLAPWPGSYWPAYQDSINQRWDGPNSLSATEKLEQAFSLSGVEDNVSNFRGIDSYSWRTPCTTSSECNQYNDDGSFDENSRGSCAIRRNETSGYCIEGWYGICHAWAPASILEPEPKFPVVHNGVEFKVNDIKALLTLIYDDVHNSWLSTRCNEQISDVQFDEYGRPIGACVDTNPGTFHVVAANYLGIKGKAFIEDRTIDYQVWNQPVRSFSIWDETEITAVEAQRLIGVSDQDLAQDSSYRFNPDAVRFVQVRTAVGWVGESASSTDGPLTADIDSYTRQDVYNYILEIDNDGKIIGGEWIGSSKTNHPDFLWLPLTRKYAWVAWGSVHYDDVSILLEKSQIDPNEPVLPTPPPGFCRDVGHCLAGETCEFTIPHSTVGQCVAGATPGLFADYPWLDVVVDRTNCAGTTIIEYQSGAFRYLFNGSTRTLYFQDGTLWCQDGGGLNCRQAYGLTVEERSWTCN